MTPHTMIVTKIITTNSGKITKTGLNEDIFVAFYFSFILNI